ncbi:MAG: metal-sensitive transcriptional regulator [Candidatus Omnitrophica bacterium]|nr:metal-sensitive transcriptional regulator [Candidatus Omnitrophota bacterium]MCM8825178.1 metal-sensitive transcriptional regulator [Candidatus Omnitrophota bacterium]
MADKKRVLSRIRRIEGQVRAVARMIERKEYCINILQQVFAIRGALKSIALIILENHINTCVRKAIVSKNDREIKKKVEELLDIYEKFSK